MDIAPRYLTFSEYSEAGGSLSEADFNYLAYEAESYIDWYTFNRLHKTQNIPEAVKRCEFYLIGLVQERLTALGIFSPSAESGSSGDVKKGIMSMSNDGVSTSFNVLSAKESIEQMKNEIGQTIQRYLQGVTNELGRKLLYRGLYPNE